MALGSYVESGRFAPPFLIQNNDPALTSNKLQLLPPVQTYNLHTNASLAVLSTTDTTVPPLRELSLVPSTTKHPLLLDCGINTHVSLFGRCHASF